MVDISKRRVIRAVIYCRISLATHGDQVKVNRQKKLCRRLAQHLGWEVVHVYSDNNKSAWQRNRERPDWDAMLAAIERGEVDAVIVYHGDRLIRQPWDLEVLLNLADGRGLHLASPVGTRDLDNADHRYQLRLDVAHACKESDNISRRTKDAHADRAAKGIVKAGGYRAFGYKRSGKVKENEAVQYRDAVARILASESKTSVLRDWSARGVLTTAGNAWEFTAFSKMLRSPRYAGLSVYRGEVVGKGRWKPLIDREAWEALQAVLDASAVRHGPTGRVAPGRYLLSGIAFHAACGTTVKVHHDSRPEALGYLCGDRECSAKVRRNVGLVDGYVIGRVLRRLADPALWERVDAAAVDDGSAADLAALEARRSATLEQFAGSMTMTPALLDGLLRRMDEQIAQIRARIAARQAVHVLDGCRDMTRGQWDALSMGRRRAIVRETVTVELLPSRRGRGFDKGSVRVVAVERE